MSKVFDQICEEGRQEIIDQLLASGMSQQEINERLSGRIRPVSKYSGPSDDPEERITAAKSLFGCIPYGKLQENEIPLSMNLNALPENKGIKAMKAASVIAEKNGLSDMTLDEINMEIGEVRK